MFVRNFIIRRAFIYTCLKITLVLKCNYFHFYKMCNNNNCQKNIPETDRTKIKGSGAVFLTHIKGILCVVLGLEAFGERKGTYSLPCGKYETKDDGCPFNTARREIYEEMNCDFNVHFNDLTESRLVWVDSNAYNLLYIYISNVYHGMFNSTNEMVRIAYIPIHSIVSSMSTKVQTVTYGKLVPGGPVYGPNVTMSKFAQCVILGMYNRGEFKLFGIAPDKMRRNKRTFISSPDNRDTLIAAEF